MKSYLLIDKNTMSRESLSNLIYTLDKNSVVHEIESLEQPQHLPEQFKSIDYVIFNSTYKLNNNSSDFLNIRKLTPNSEIILIVPTSQHLNSEELLDYGAKVIITLNSSKNEFIAAIRSLNLGKPFIGQYVLRSTDNEDIANTSEKLPILKNRFANEIKSKLTNRQCEVLDYMTKGYANKLIAYELGVSEGTIKLHVSSILRALKVTNRTEAAMQAGQFLTSHAH